MATTMAAKPKAETRARFAHFSTITTRWMDNDVYRHINNVQYYSFFDTAVNGYLLERGVLDIDGGDVIGLVVETHCNFLASAAFPQAIEAGIRVAHLGRSSVRYELGLFVEGRDEAVAQGHFVHVYVDRADHQPVELPAELRAVLEDLLVA